MANINAVITYNANLSPAQAQIRALTGQIGTLTAAFNTLDKSALKAQSSLAATFASNVGQIGGFTAQTVKAHTAVEGFGKAIAANRLTMRQYFREAFAGYIKQNSLMKQLAMQQVAFQKSIAVSTAANQAMIITPAQISAVSNATAIASQKFAIFNKLIDGGATALLNFGKNTQWAGRQLMVGFTLPLALFTAAVSKQFRDLDKELTRFQKVYGQDLGGAIQKSTLVMREQVKQLAYDIGREYGIAASETAALAADIAATGAEGEKLVKSIQQTTRLSVLGEVDRQDAMKTTLALQTAFKMNTDELSESINYLNAVENQTSTTLQDFTAAIPKAGPIVKSLGGEIQDLAMMLVAMREGGIPAAEAANAIKSGLASLINPTQKAADVAEKFGINLRKIVEDNKGQLMPTIYSLQNALEGLDDFARARVIEEIFGKYQFARISALFANLGKIGSQTQSVLELTAKSSTELAAIANAELKTLQESTAVRFQRTLENLRNALMPIGEMLTETLIPVFQFIGTAASKFTEFFESLPEPVKNFAKYGVAITALAGPVIMMVGLFGNLIANGIKFAMMIVRIGARIAGLKVEKFELLNAEVMAAKLGVDTLTGSFTTQEKALRQLINAMGAYGSSLRTLQTTNPALFAAGAGKPPIRRASGSSRPEFVPGSGRGDKIPAMLEPGEFIVNRSATEKYAPVLMQMNRGTLPGFQEGTNSPVGFGKGKYSAPGPISAMFPMGPGQERGHIFGPGGAGITSSVAKTMKLDNQYFMWHKAFWVEMSQEENQLMNMINRGTATNMPLFEKTIASMNVNEELASRVIAKMKSGTMMFEEESAVAHQAIRAMVNGINNGTIGATEVSKKFMEFATPISKLPQLTSVTVEKLREAEQQLIRGISSIATTSGPQAQAARSLLAEKLLLIRGLIEQVGQAPTVINAEIAKILQMSSPSRVFEQIGRNTASGLLKGVRSAEGSARGAGVELANEIILGVRATSGNGMLGVGPGGSAGWLMGGPSPYAPKGGQKTFLGMPAVPPKSPIEPAMKASRMGATTNAVFAGSMLLSTITMFSGATGEAAEKLTLFSNALMAAMFAVQASQGLGIGGKIVGGVSRAGGGIASLGTKLAGGGGGMVGGLGRMLASGGGAIAGAAGPVTIGVAAALAVTAGSLYLYKQSLDEARERAIAAFKDPVETMKFFGKEVGNITETLKGIQNAHASRELADVNSQLREAVSSDYATLIEKIKNSVVSVGSADLGAAYTKMLISGMSAEEAQDAIKAIAAESGTAGGAAYAKAFSEGLLNSKTPEEAFGRMVEMIDPSSDYNRRRVQSLQAEQQSISRDRVVGVRGFSGYTPEQLDKLGSISEAMQVSGETFAATMEAAIQLSQTSPDIVAENAEKIRQAYLGLSTSGGGLFGMGQSAQEVAYDSFKNMIGELKDPVLNKIVDSLQNATPEAQALAMELVAVGGDLNDAADAAGNFDETLARAAINGQIRLAELTAAVNEAKEALLDFADADLINEKIDRAQKRLDRFSKARDSYAKQREKEKEALEESFQATEDGVNNEIDALNKEKDAIEKTANAYIKSLQRRAKAEDFYAGQRQGSLGALSELASGNVFGFLQARQDLSKNAMNFAYDNEIQKIEDRRDAEVDAIDETIDKKQALIDLNNKAHDDQMKAFDKETERQQKALTRQYNQQSTHVNNMKQLQKDIKDGQIKTYDEIKNAFGTRLADEYEMLVENEIKKTAAMLRGQVLTGQITVEGAQKSLIDMFNALQGGTAYSGGTPTALGGYSRGVSDYATLAEILGLGPLGGPPSRFVVGSGDYGNTGTGRATGGYISGPGTGTSDSIPARLSNGEYVVKASSVSKYGKGMMDSINAQRFAAGGLVEGGPSTASRASINYANPKYLESRRFPKKEKQQQILTSNFPTYDGNSSYIPGTPVPYANPPITPGLSGVLSLAQQYQHLPYVGSYPIPTDANGNPTGWGCATSVAWLYQNGAGITLPSPSLSYGQYSGLRQDVSRANIAPGDLVFYYNATGVNTQNPVNHVEMYMGGGKVFNGGVGIQGGFSNHPIVGFKRPAKFATGGFVNGFGGPRSDSIPAMLSNGEYVMKSGAVNKYGRGFMDQVNNGNFQMPSFGMPSSPSSVNSSVANNAYSNNSSYSSNSSSNVKIIINGASGKSATAIANKVASMINSSNNRRNHSRSI